MADPASAGGFCLEDLYGETLCLSNHLRAKHGMTLDAGECSIILDEAAQLGIVVPTHTLPTPSAVEAAREAFTEAARSLGAGLDMNAGRAATIMRDGPFLQSYRALLAAERAAQAAQDGGGADGR